MKAVKSSTHGDQEDGRFPFELLPHEIKEMILERVIDETADFDDFQKFWRLKLVNKEFNSILSSNYARRHFPKYRFEFMFRKHDIENHVNMYIIANGFPKYEPGQLFKKHIEIKWEDVPRYFKDKPFRIRFLDIEAVCAVLNDHMVPALKELANQTSESVSVRVLIRSTTRTGRFYYSKKTVTLEEFIHFFIYKPDGYLGRMCSWMPKTNL
ncbi:unnamed protein product [Auanema sp. JU1783]|nr:unnamed protein product [Auanema sp. JU1783]